MKKLLALSLVLTFCFMFSGCAKTCDRCSEDYTGAEIEYDFYGRTLYICVPCAEKLELYKEQANSPSTSSSEQSSAESEAGSSQESVASKTESVTESTVSSESTQSTVSSAPSQNAASKPSDNNTVSYTGTPPSSDGLVGGSN